MSISVVPPAALANNAVNTLQGLASITSGFQINNAGAMPQPAIRGVSTINSGQFENNVALYVDGLYQNTSVLLLMELPDVQDIQLLKGPQGTLYGRNATGGAILLDTKAPGRNWTGNLEGSYASYEDRRVRGYVAGPINDRIGISIAGTYRKTGGYYEIASRTTPGQFDGDGLGQEQQSLRGKVKIELSDHLTATAGYNYLYASVPSGVNFTPIQNVPNSYAVPGRNTRPTSDGEVSGDVFENNVRQYEGSLKLELDTGIGKLRSITGRTINRSAVKYDFTGSYVPDSYSSYVLRERMWQESIDYNITAVRHLDLVVGGNYFNIAASNDPNGLNNSYVGPANYRPNTYPDPATTVVPLSAYRLASSYQFLRTKQAWAIFLDGTYHLTGNLSLSAGGRYSRETQDVAGYKNVFCSDPLSPTTLNCTLGAVISTPYTLASSAKRSTYSKFTPSAAMRFQIAPRTNIYASFTEGFRSGEWANTLPSDNPALWRDAKQETIRAYEVGLKSAGRLLRFDAAGFYYDYTNLQVSYTSQINNMPVVLLQNAPKATIYGAEFSADYKALSALNLHAGATWLHARYGKGFNFSGSGVDPTKPGFNVNSDPLKTFQNVTVAQNLSGLQMARAPDFSGYAGFDYTVPIHAGKLLLAGNVKYTSSYVPTNPSVWGGDPTFNAKLAANPNALPDNSVLLAGTPYSDRSSEQRTRQSGYALIDASLTWTDTSDRFYIRLWSKNLTNKIYRLHFNALASGSYTQIGEPRVIGGTLGFRF